MPAFIFVFLVHGDYYTALSYHIFCDVYVFLFTYVKAAVIWFDTLV